MLAERFSTERLAEMLLSRENFHPFPTVVEREQWANVPEALRQALIADAEKYLGYQWPQLPATLYVDYSRTGNRSRYEEICFGRRYTLGTLVIAECLEGKGRFLDDILNGLWAICEESSWCIPAHNWNDTSPEHCRLPDITAPIIDLFAAETGALLSWTSYLMGSQLDAMSPLIMQRLTLELQRRIIRPYIEDNSFWWTGFQGRFVNNWNPWCNSNSLATCLLVEKDEQLRVQAVAKGIRSLDHFLQMYHPDGGCDEGTSYWGAAGGALFECLEMLYRASAGGIDFFDIPLIGEIGRYVARMHIDKDYFVNFADGAARVPSMPAHLLYRYGRRIGDTGLASLGAWLYRYAGVPGIIARWYPMYRRLPELFESADLVSDTGTPSFYRDVWLPGIQVMVAREQEGSERGFFLAAKGGTNGESHNHNDVGQFILYSNGRPVLIDVGVEVYTAKTFSADRYDIWTMQSAYHNLPTVNAVQQAPGGEYHASEVTNTTDDAGAHFSLNIANAYPAEAGITRWKRSYRLIRGQHVAVEVMDDFELNAETADIMLTLMTPCTPQIANGTITLDEVTGERVQIRFPADRLSAKAERIEISDENLLDVWGDHLYRLVFYATAPTQSERWSMSITR